MVVRKNERIDRVLTRYKRGARDGLTMELYHIIEEYRVSTERRLMSYIHEYVQQMQSERALDPSDARKDFMIWTENHVEKALRGYMRGEYAQIEEILNGQKVLNQFRLTVDVLKKKADQYKTLADIGITIEATDSEHRDWLPGWKDYAERMKTLPAIYETHAHYNMEQYKKCREQLLKEMHEAGIAKCIVPSVEAYCHDGQGKMIDCNRQILESLAVYDWIRFGFGSHPKYLWKDTEWDDARWEEFEQLLSDPHCVAVGEAGLDYSYPAFCEEHRIIQESFFVRFIDLANKYGLPLILHIRPAIDPVTGMADSKVDEDALRILKEHPIRNGAVCHCFGGDEKLAQMYIECGVEHFGIGGRILNNEQALVLAVKYLPEECLVLETDAPYVNTIGIPGPNTSYSLIKVAEKIAELRGTTAGHVIEFTYENAEQLFERKCVQKTE